MTTIKLSHKQTDDNSLFQIISDIQRGLSYVNFKNIAQKTAFTLSDWSSYLHLSERSLQRYEKENKSFDPLQSQQIVRIAMLYNRGEDVFGSLEKFNKWMSWESIALGGIKPKQLLDTTFGIEMIEDELTRIEHGVLA
ncbi:MAG: DUF2384 domain-containing protein [Saprospiraceae bacterium]|nr:DUF2384 domain-containing protein [Saprospiraceae bacterium]